MKQRLVGPVGLGVLAATAAMAQTVLPPGSHTVRPGVYQLGEGQYSLTIQLPKFSLTVTQTGTGEGTAGPTGLFPEGTTIALQATPAAGSRFDGWSGDPDCADRQVTLTGPRSCTAIFTLASAPGSPPASPPPAGLPATEVAGAPDNGWIKIDPPMRPTYQSVVPGLATPNATVRFSARSGNGVRVTASAPVFLPEHVGHGIGNGNLSAGAVIRKVESATSVLVDIVKGTFPDASYGPKGWNRTTGTLNQVGAMCLRQVDWNGPVNRSYSGWAYGGGRLFYYGGAHGTHPGNDIDMYLVNENRWEHQAPPQCPPWPEWNWLGTGTFTNALAPARDLADFHSPDGEPFTMHSYENMTYDAPRNRFLWVGGGGTWAYYPETRTLRNLAGPTQAKKSPIWMSGGAIEVDPPRNRLLAWVGEPQYGSMPDTRGVYAMDLTTDTWAFLYPSPPACSSGCAAPPLSGRQVFVTYNPDLDEHYLFFWGISSPLVPKELWRYKSTSNRWTLVASTPDDLITALPAMDYDTRNKRLVVLRPMTDTEPHKLWAWDPVADTWEDLGAGTGLAAWLPEGRGRFKYDAEHNVFWTTRARNTYCGIMGAKCGGLAETWAYRYKAAGGAPLPPPAPASPVLTIQMAGSGAGTVHPVGTFPLGTEVQLTATPAANSRFAGWSGDPDCLDGKVLVDGPKTCIATFVPLSASTAALAIPLTVAEPSQVRRIEGVTTGVPLPPNVDPTGPWSLWKGDLPIRVQVKPAQHRTPWLLLDFVADVPAGATAEYVLKTGAAPMAAPPAPVSAAQADAYARTVVVDATSRVTWTGTMTGAAWEAQGPVRWTRRVDGRYANGLTYTLRLTWWAGLPQVRIVYTIKNNLPTNQRHVKLRSAKVIVGTGAATARVEKHRVPIAVPPNATIEALPKSYPGIAGLSAELRVPGALDIDPNGGFVIMDLSHYAETFLVNGDSRAAAAPLVAMAPPKHYAQHGHLSSERWSTTQDELDYTAAQGWTWTASQVPTWPHQPDYTIQAVDVDLHSESESDDCWQNIMMWLRSGTRGFWDRARGWCDYQRDEMTRRTEGWSFAWDADGEGPTRVARPTIEIPLTAADQAYLGASSYGRVGYFPRINTSHFWGWGLVDWALLTGDPEAVPAAVDLAEINRRHFGWRTDGLGQRGRTGARALMHAVRVFEATGAEEWRQYMEHLATNYTERDPSWLEWAGHYTVPLPDLGPEWRGMNPHHFANLDQAFERYVAAGGARAQEIKRRLVRMGDFALEWALHPLWLHSSSTIAVTPDGRQWVSSMDENPPAVAQINPYHTLTWVDTLVRAYRLSGDRKFLAHAAFMHERATRHRYGQQVLSAPFVMPPKVGRFLNNGQQIGRIYYPDHGHLQFAHLLFADALAAGVPIRPRPVFTASAATVPFDGSVTLSWAADGGATACQGGYGWNGPLPASGTRTLAGLKTNRGYVLTCREPLQSLVVPVKVGPAPASEPGLALRWSFNTGDIDSTLPDQVSLIDRSGNGRNGSVEDATLIPGRMGQALSFAGYTSGLTGPYGRSDLAMALPPAVSFAAWLRFGATQTSEAVALAYGRFGYPRAMNWQLSGSALQVKIRFDGPATASLDVPGLGDGHWHHVAVVFSPTQTVLYVDGRARGSLPNGPVAWYADELYLATDKALKRFAKVDLDEVRVLLRTLTAAEVAALAQSPTP